MLTTIEQEIAELTGDNHQLYSIDTPLRPDALEKTDEAKIANIQYHFGKIMEELGLDLSDDSLKGTPYRVAKMYVKELFNGLNPLNKPKISVFDNKYQYSKLLIERNIAFSSACEHHFLPIIGRVHVGYLSSGKVIGLSKIHRIVEHFSRRPQVQERLSIQIFTELKTALDTQDVIVVIDAEHLCVSTRGVKDITSKTLNMEYGGHFTDAENRAEFTKLLSVPNF